MPVPIVPTGTVPRQNDSDKDAVPQLGSGIDVSLLGGILKTEESKKTVKLSDSEASLLFRVWRESSEMGDDMVQIPDTVSSSDVLRLKTLGLVSGDEVNRVKFTTRAKQVIKTIVLNEENYFESTRVHKPYNQILADSNKSKGMRLALGKGK
jgi:hypothetical protein